MNKQFIFGVPFTYFDEFNTATSLDLNIELSLVFSNSKQKVKSLVDLNWLNSTFVPGSQITGVKFYLKQIMMDQTVIDLKEELQSRYPMCSVEIVKSDIL